MREEKLKKERKEKKEGPVEVKRELLSKVKIGSRRIFAKKQVFKLKIIERPNYMRDIDSSFNKKGLIEYTVKMNIYY